MIRNYLRTSIRILTRNKMQSTINIFGLAMGIAIFLLIMIYSQNELSTNEFHTNHKNIYQVEIGDGFYTMAPLGIMFKNNIPDFDDYVRIDYYLGGGQSPLLETNTEDVNKKMKVKDIIFADPNLFDVFDFPVLYGDPATALKDPYSIVLTRSTAQRLFGKENVVGESVHYIGDRNSQPQMDMTVTAIVENVPNNSSIVFNAVGSFKTLNAVSNSDINQNWNNWMFSTFIKFNKHNVNAFSEKANQFWYEQENRLGNDHQKLSLIQLADVPFHKNNKRQFIFLLQLIGVFILAIGMINFVNLTTAKSTTRAREIGIRKVIGAHRSMLIKQFLSESILISLLAAPLAMVIVELSKPYFFKLIDKQIPFDLLSQPLFILVLFAFIVLLGIVAGIYPAIILSAFKPSSILKSEITKGKKGNALRHTLIVFQFAISIALIICTLLISKQVEFLNDKDLGYNSKNIIHFKQSQQINQKYDVFKQKLLQNPNVLSVSRSNHALAQEMFGGSNFELNGLKKPARVYTVDPDFVPSMEIQMIEGRPFSWDIQSDLYQTIIVNETFVKEFGLNQALNSEIVSRDRKFQIIGVMKDFHYNSFHQKVEPTALRYADWNSQINIRISGQNTSAAIPHVKDVWNEFSSEIPFEYEFLDKSYSKLYKMEEQFQGIINSFSLIAIIIACLGLFGLVSYSTNIRIEEIGIRKILGASVGSIVFTLTRDFIKWVLFANLIAWPVAWLVMNKWLQNFAYHTSISLWIFLLAGGLVITIALITMSWQTIRAATANPVKALRNE